MWPRTNHWIFYSHGHTQNKELKGQEIIWICNLCFCLFSFPRNFKFSKNTKTLLPPQYSSNPVQSMVSSNKRIWDSNSHSCSAPKKPWTGVGSINDTMCLCYSNRNMLHECKLNMVKNRQKRQGKKSKSLKEKYIIKGYLCNICKAVFLTKLLTREKGLQASAIIVYCQLSALYTHFSREIWISSSFAMFTLSPQHLTEF